MRFFIDECISPMLARCLNESGEHDAVHPRDRGRLQDPDHVVFQRAIDQDRILVTENADDFRKLAARVDLHPGIIILPSVKRDEAERIMRLAIEHLCDLSPSRPQDGMVNRILAVSAAGVLHFEPLP